MMVKIHCAVADPWPTYISIPDNVPRISSDAVKAYLSYQPDLLVTACPLCKKTFMKTDTAVPIKDIAEVVAENCR